VEAALKTTPEAASSGTGRAWLGYQAAILKKEEKLVATTWAASLNTKISALQAAPKVRILVIEDDRALRKILERLLTSEAYEVDVVPDGAAGLEMIGQRPPSTVIIDLQHPASSGCDLCKKIAKSIPFSHLLILSASSDVADKGLFLGMDADDYVTMPFSPRELIARLHSLVSRV
jgi:CheY-like chemotaxis protein